MKLRRHLCSNYATKIVTDMRGVSRIGVVAIATPAITSSNYITACALLETADCCRTTSSTEFHQTLSFPSSIGKGSGLRDYVEIVIQPRNNGSTQRVSCDYTTLRQSTLNPLIVTGAIWCPSHLSTNKNRLLEITFHAFVSAFPGRYKIKEIACGCPLFL